MDKRGWTHFSKKSPYSLLLGVISIVVGASPFLKTYLKLNIPVINSTLPAEILLVVGSLLILFNSFNIRRYGLSRTSMLVAVLVAFVGLMPILIRLKILKSLPFVIELSVVPEYINILLVFFGTYLFFESLFIKY